jgi:hypothetical protein
MDLNLYLRVIWRFWRLVLIGLIVATVLAVLSVYRVDTTDGYWLEHRQKEKWVSVATVLVTEPDFPLGRAVFEQDVPPLSSGKTQKFTPEFAPSSRFIELANVYAELVTSDAVRKLILKDGRLPGVVKAVPLMATNGSDASLPLPMVGVQGIGSTPENAVTVARRASDAFRRYLRAEQDRGAIPVDQRVVLTEVRHPSLATTVLLEGRPKTVPIVVFLTVMLAVVGLAFILENLRPRVRAVPVDVHSAPAATPVRARSSG